MVHCAPLTWRGNGYRPSLPFLSLKSQGSTLVGSNNHDPLTLNRPRRPSEPWTGCSRSPGSQHGGREGTCGSRSRAEKSVEPSASCVAADEDVTKQLLGLRNSVPNVYRAARRRPCCHHHVSQTRVLQPVFSLIYCPVPVIAPLLSLFLWS